MEANTVVVRGFSNTFGLDKKVEVMDLQFIEGEELEQKWKEARRQRLKQQEDMIWNEFVKEEDILMNVCKEDPYQFLEQLPEDQVKELVECELSRIKKVVEGQKCGAGDSPREENHAVTFSDMERDEVFHIYDDDKDASAGDENLTDTLESPCTVRERDSGNENIAQERVTIAPASGASVPPNMGPTEKNSSENVATVIESSIYCAKVRELRIKIIAELQDIIVSLENQNIASIDLSQLHQLCRRAAEYSSRYQRIHLYQLQRQVNDIKRHNAQALPFAKHTQFQSQMVRIVALHQNTLQSLQVFHKAFEQTACLRECSAQLCAICATLRDSTAACLEVAVPSDFSAAKALYNDSLLATCDELQDAVRHYVTRVDEYIAAANQVYTTRSSKKSGKTKEKKRNWSQNATKNTSATEANARLSMYSLDTLRSNQKGTRGYTKSEKGRSDSSHKKGKIESPKSHRKSPRTRRPLMRNPHAGLDRKRAVRAQPDHDIQTMVEAVEVPSSMSRDTSPYPSRRPTPRRKPPGKQAPCSPRNAPLVPPIALRSRTPRARNSPNAATKRINPYIKGPASTTAQTNQPGQTSPVFKQQFDKKDYRDIEDSEVQTMMSDCKLNFNGRFDESARSGDFYRDGCDIFTNKDRLKSGPDSARSESSKNALSGRSDHTKEVEGLEVTQLLKQLCAGDSTGNKTERQTGAKNAQLVCVKASSPRQPTTPQLLRILEETIQKKIPNHMYMKLKDKDSDKMRLAFNIPQQIADNLFQYRTKFVQHMLTSSMYANSAVGKPWEMVGSVSECIIDEVLMNCAEEMQILPKILELYKSETQ